MPPHGTCHIFLTFWCFPDADHLSLENLECCKPPETFQSPCQVTLWAWLSPPCHWCPPSCVHRAGAMEAASCLLQKCVGCLLPFPHLCITLPPKHSLYSLLPHSTLSKSGQFPFVLLALFFFPFFSHFCFSALPALTP